MRVRGALSARVMMAGGPRAEFGVPVQPNALDGGAYLVLFARHVHHAWEDGEFPEYMEYLTAEADVSAVRARHGLGALQMPSRKRKSGGCGAGAAGATVMRATPVHREKTLSEARKRGAERFGEEMARCTQAWMEGFERDMVGYAENLAYDEPQRVCAVKAVYAPRSVEGGVNLNDHDTTDTMPELVSDSSSDSESDRAAPVPELASDSSTDDEALEDDVMPGLASDSSSDDDEERSPGVREGSLSSDEYEDAVEHERVCRFAGSAQPHTVPDIIESTMPHGWAEVPYNQRYEEMPGMGAA